MADQQEEYIRKYDEERRSKDEDILRIMRGCYEKWYLGRETMAAVSCGSVCEFAFLSSHFSDEAFYDELKKVTDDGKDIQCEEFDVDGGKIFVVTKKKIAEYFARIGVEHDSIRAAVVAQQKREKRKRKDTDDEKKHTVADDLYRLATLAGRYVGHDEMMRQVLLAGLDSIRARLEGR